MVVVVVVVLCLCIVWAGYQDASFGLRGRVLALVGLQATILVVMGASQVGTSVGAARASGILDFHRISPLSPTELTLGFFFGAPVREYVLFACTLPFSLCTWRLAFRNVHAFVQLMIFLMASAWSLHGLALLNALLARARTNPRGVVGLVIFVVLFGGNLAISLGRATPLFVLGIHLSFAVLWRSVPVAGCRPLAHGRGSVLCFPGSTTKDGHGAESRLIEVAVNRRPRDDRGAPCGLDLEAGGIRGT